MKTAVWVPAVVVGLIGSQYTAIGSCWRTIPRVDSHNNPVRACSFGAPTPPAAPLCVAGYTVTQNDQLTDATGGWPYGKSSMGAVQKICQYRFQVYDANGDCVYAYSSRPAGGTEATGSACPMSEPPGGPGGIH